MHSITENINRPAPLTKTATVTVIVKRAYDIALSAVLLVLLAPVMALLGLIVWIDTGEYPIFRQQRGLTLEKRRFTIYKFRTLKSGNAEGISGENNIFTKDSLSGRVTLTGRWLRATGLDELPQLLNVLKGEMSFIGPRPLSTEDLELMKKENPEHYLRRGMFTSRPRISGYWQIFGERSKGIDNLIELEIKYETEKSIILDLFLMALTLPVVLFAKHSDAIQFRVKNQKLRFNIGSVNIGQVFPVRLHKNCNTGYFPVLRFK